MLTLKRWNKRQVFDFEVRKFLIPMSEYCGIFLMPSSIKWKTAQIRRRRLVCLTFLRTCLFKVKDDELSHYFFTELLIGFLFSRVICLCNLFAYYKRVMESEGTEIVTLLAYVYDIQEACATSFRDLFSCSPSISETFIRCPLPKRWLIDWLKGLYLIKYS